MKPGTYSNGFTPASITVEDLQKAAEELRPVGDAIARDEMALFLKISGMAAARGVPWIRVAENLVEAAPEADREMVKAGLAAAMRRGCSCLAPQFMSPDDLATTLRSRP